MPSAGVTATHASAPPTTTAAAAGPSALTRPLGALTAGNYSFTFVDGTLTITKATLTVKANDKAREYGDANPSFDATISGFKNGENLGTSGVTGSPACSTTAIAASPVGPFPITCLLGTLAATNYDFSFVGGTLSITKATLTVTADDKTRIYGDANPSFTVTYTGFKNGQNLGTSGVTGSPSCSTTAVAASPVGPYTITCSLGTLAAGDYQFMFVSGTLTVNPAPRSVTANTKS